jgi:hypothetical protein
MPPQTNTLPTEIMKNDLKWGKLLNDEGKPTKRLGQFLRGLANHIVGATTLYLMSGCLLTLA